MQYNINTFHAEKLRLHIKNNHNEFYKQILDNELDKN